MAKEKAVRCIATWMENAQPKFVQGRVYALDAETERLVTVHRAGEFIEVDRTVEKLQLATAAARNAEALLAAAEGALARAQVAARDAQAAVADQIAAVEAEDPDKPKLITAARALIDARHAADLAAETAAAAKVTAGEEVDAAGQPLDDAERKKRADAAMKAADELTAAQSAVADADVAALALADGNRVDVDAVVAAIEIAAQA